MHKLDKHHALILKLVLTIGCFAAIQFDGYTSSCVSLAVNLLWIWDA